MNNIAIIQARTGSTRLPYKVLKQIEQKPVLQHVIERVKQSKLIDEVIVATSMSFSDLAIVKLCINLGIRVFCGSENDVLDRYYQVAKNVCADNIIRITADCPLHDAEVIDKVLQAHIENKSDYTSNILEETFPDGLDCEVITYKTLEEIWHKAKMASEREHVTLYIIQNNCYKKTSVVDKENHGFERWTLDTEEDFLFISEVYKELYHLKPFFKYQDILTLLNNNPKLRQINKGFLRNEGIKKSLINDYIIC